MKNSASIALTALALLLASEGAGPAAAPAPYFPYDTIEDYYKHGPQPPAADQAKERQPPEPPVKAAPKAEQPIAVTQAPQFLFPAELGFGVAVGVPFDMVYLGKAYYYWQGGSWYRAPSYRGPWTALGYGQLPTELRKHKIAKIRKLRNREFSDYWKNRDHYRGKQFNPDQERREH